MLIVSLDTHLNTFHLELSFSAEVGRTTVMLGESGAGKSMVLRLLAGLLHPERGHIAFEGITYFDSERRIIIPPQHRPFGYVFQDYALFPHLSVFENVAFGLRAQYLPRQLIRRRVGEALEQVRLSGLDKRRPAQLSGGQQQRVAIARALALQPRLLLLDEPLAALDVQTRREVRQELRRILTNIGITTVFVTHQYLEALVFGHHILVIDHGQLIQQGSQRDLLERPRSSYVAELVGTNFFRGRVVRCETNTICTIRLDDNHERVIEISATLDRAEAPTINRADAKELIRAPQAPLRAPCLGDRYPTRPYADKAPGAGEEAFVVVDPRSITLYQTPPDSSARNIFRGEIVQLLHLGASGNPGNMDDGRMRVSIQLDSAGLRHGRTQGHVPTVAPLLTAEITAASAARMELLEGKTVYATFKATEARAYI
jgi:molybdate transport system ATP-binding protein